MEKEKHFDVSDKLYSFPGFIFEGLKEKGINVAKMLESQGINPLIAVDPGCFVSKKEMDSLFSHVFRIVDDPVFWIRKSKMIQPQSAGIVGYTAMSCDTLKEAYYRIARYKEICSGSRMFFEERDTETSIFYDIEEGSCFYSKYLIEIGIVSLICIGRWLCNKDFSPLRVNFKFSEPSYLSEYSTIFSSPIFFQQSYNEVVFKNDILDLKVVTANKKLFQTFTEHADRILEKLNTNASTTDSVKKTVRDLFKGEMPSIDKVARKMGLSRRTLQRRLKEEKTTFNTILENERKSLAIAYVGKSQLNIGEIAYLIGFLDLSSFYRAFKRWTGSAPQSYRMEYGVKS